MPKKYNPELVANAKELRKNMTKEESHLWYDFLRNYPIKFTRQKILGKYIADFYCPSAKLIVELDGSQHYEDKELEYDAERTEYLKKFGIEVIRFTNREIHDNFEEVCQAIDNKLNGYSR